MLATIVLAWKRTSPLQGVIRIPKTLQLRHIVAFKKPSVLHCFLQAVEMFGGMSQKAHGHITFCVQKASKQGCLWLLLLFALSVEPLDAITGTKPVLRRT